ncbi:DNA primase [Microbacterium sp. P5_E9]
MAGRIRQADVDEVKARTNIADIIGERVALKSAGVGAMKGLCPFHDERSPSFNVRAQAGFYHCFGCGESGDVYSFLRAMDHVSFTEAVERLAGRIGYTLHYEDGGAAPENTGRTRLYAANAAAAEFFRSQLPTAEADIARRFLGERGFDAGAAAHFGVGFAPKGWSAMLDALTVQGFTRDELITSGLVSQGQRGVYDRFRGRVVWPIRDVTGQVIGFGARRLFDDDNGPKYLNTPETPLYKKAGVLYGLDLAKREISRSHRVVVVEGYTDVMACHLAGVTTAIATCGTAFGSDHITALRRVMGDDSTAGEVVFTFDPDAAGQKAAIRAFADAKRFNAQTYVAVGPDGLDPCDLRLRRGDGAVRTIVDEKVPMVEFVLDQRITGFDLASVEGRVGALRSAAPVVAELRDPLLQPEYVRVLARRLGMDTEDVRREVERAGRGARHAPEAAVEPVGDESDGAPIVRVTMRSLPRTAEVALERDALMGFLQFGHRLDPELRRQAVDLPFRHPALDAVRSAVAAAPDMDRPGWAADAVGTVREPFRSLAAELLTSDFPARDDDHAVASASDLARRLIARMVDQEKSELLGAIQRVPPNSDEGRRIRIRLRELDAQRQRLVLDS